MKSLAIYAPIFILLASTGCSGGDSISSTEGMGDANTVGCEPNDINDCVDRNGNDGIQLCQEDGMSYGPCLVDTSAVEGGSGGNAGTTFSAGGSPTGGNSTGGGDAGSNTSGGSDSGGSSAGGSDSGSAGSNTGGSDSGGPNCQPKTCATLTVELSGETNGEYDACGLLDDGCGGYVDCSGCTNKTPFDDFYASCNEGTSLCESDCIIQNDPTIAQMANCPAGNQHVVCYKQSIIPPQPTCTFGVTTVTNRDVWCCPN